MRRRNEEDSTNPNLSFRGLNRLRANGRVRGGGISRKPTRSSMAWSHNFEPGSGTETQPFYGFPGGRPAWVQFRQTGQTAPGVEFSPSQRDFYNRRVVLDPNYNDATSGVQDQLPQWTSPAAFQPQANTPMPPGASLQTAPQNFGPTSSWQPPPSAPASTASTPQLPSAWGRAGRYVQPPRGRPVL